MNPIVVIIAAALFFIGAFFILYRIMFGPSVLDRITASDAMLGTLMCLLGFEMVLNKHTYTLPVMLAIAVFAMLSAVAVARFIRKKDPNDER